MFLSSNLFVQWIANPTKASPRCKRGLVLAPLVRPELCFQYAEVNTNLL
jgi:hypothetical protein